MASKRDAEVAALYVALDYLADTLERVIDHRPGPGVSGSADALLASAIGTAEISLKLMVEKDHYPELRALRRLPEAVAKYACITNAEQKP